MKKKIIIGLILVLAMSIVGCEDKKEASSKDDNNVKQEDTNSSNDNENSEEQDEGDNEKEHSEGADEVDTTIKISDEKMLEIYETAMPTVRSHYESICPEPLIEVRGGDSPDPNQIISLEYQDYDNLAVGQAQCLYYVLNYSDDGDIDDISGLIDLNYDASKIATEGFKFEESALYPVVEALSGAGHDFSEVNEEVQKYYQEGGDNTILYNNEYFGFSINCSDSRLYFGYTYYSERSE